MKVLNLGRFLTAILVVCIMLSCQSQAVVGNSLKILLPLYIYPNWYEPKTYVWSDVASAAQRVPIMAIINPNNGPDGKPPNQDYQRGLKDLRQSNITILGYVYTQYGDRSIEEVKQDIDLYNNYYDVDGIFLDESASDIKQINYYQELYNYIKTKTNLDQVIINPGTDTDESYLNRPAADLAVIFEDYSQAWKGYKPKSYVNKYQSKYFASLIHSVADATTMKSYIDHAIACKIGYIYVTDDSPTSDDGDPWNSLPSYWQEEIEYIRSLNESSK
ncbi:conserved exported protein of unknown function [Stanieria cyanosphaera PCC 7437]|uniref:Spherulation-specific family 4 n=1 Tax=Stanieria cyanosphaera (strain ATCC 29371 / PCC 7437) TaxID=111780 RepID=K9XRN7_STAC7|nr:spherulation-specific family 4 protein [Stanieria cyanosphaera]AFZ35275.1 conserved exported protein of unknown function [Stanieria cyanosphaera PCC 7437]